MSLELEITRYTQWFNLCDCHFDFPSCVVFLQHRPTVKRLESWSLLLSHSWPMFTATKFVKGLRNKIPWWMWMAQWIFSPPTQCCIWLKLMKKCYLKQTKNRNKNKKPQKLKPKTQTQTKPKPRVKQLSVCEKHRSTYYYTLCNI